MVMLPPTLARCESLGYKVFDNPKYDYDLNIVAIRAVPGLPNRFDDCISVHYLWDGTWRSHQWPATTDPGTYHLRNPSNVRGTAILAEGNYRKSHMIGKHRGVYDCLKQSGPVSVFRDPDRDALPERWGEPESGLFGINIHKAGKKESDLVSKWSAGCCVFSRSDDFEEFMELCRKQISFNGFDTFSLTLLNQWF